MQGGVFNGEVLTPKFNQVSVSAPPIWMEKGTDAASDDRARRTSVVVLVSAPEVVVDSDLQANKPGKILGAGLHGTTMNGVGEDRRRRRRRRR